MGKKPKLLNVIEWDGKRYILPVFSPYCSWTRKRKKFARKINRIMGRSNYD